MKKKHLFFCMGLSAMALLSSCSERDFDLKPSDGSDKSETGKIVLNLNADASFDDQTRALNEADYRNTNNFTVQLLQGDKVLTECKGSELEDVFPKELTPGTYAVKAFYGNESPYSRETFRVEGVREFNVSKGSTSNVEVSCLPTCGKLTVDFDPSMATYYEAYSVTYSGAESFAGNSIAWLKIDTDPWYVKLKMEGETLTYTITVTAKSDYAHVDANGDKQTTGSVTGQFALQRNHRHKLSVKPNYTPTSEGGLKLEIVIDGTLNEHKETIVVPVTWL